MMRFFVLQLCLFSAFCFQLFAQSPRTGQDYAVFFYVTDFQSGWAKLPETATEADQLKTELETNFGFTCEAVANPSKATILAKIKAYNDRLTANDQVLFFFSMHGHYDATAERGFLIAADGDLNDDYGQTWLSYDDLSGFVARCKAKHVLLALDACHSGSFGIRNKSRPDAPSYSQAEDCNQRVAKMMQYAGRQYCSSGNKESKTPAKSLFASRLLEALRTGGEDGIVRFADLEYFLSKVNLPRPESGSFRGHEAGGEFFFVRNGGCASTPLIQSAVNGLNDRKTILEEDEDTAWQNVSLINTKDSYSSYLLLFRKGKYRRKALVAIDSIQLSQLSKKFQPPDPFLSNMVFVEGGIFDMGCPQNSDYECPEIELPTHQVKLQSFYIGKFEVTQSEWKGITGDSLSKKSADCPDCPMTGVSWQMIQEFLTRLNAQTASQYRLPTEAEWEYAARGGAKTKGYRFAGGDDLDLVAWHDGNAAGAPHPIGIKMPNELGLHDMSGNVCEWCQDKWHGNYKNAPIDGVSWIQGGEAGRVFRGGCWNRLYLRCDINARYWDYSHSRFDNVGFRLAKPK